MHSRKARRKEREGEAAGDPKLYLQEALLERQLPELDVRQLVELPRHLDYNEWLASHSQYPPTPRRPACRDDRVYLFFMTATRTVSISVSLKSLGIPESTTESSPRARFGSTLGRDRRSVVVATGFDKKFASVSFDGLPSCCDAGRVRRTVAPSVQIHTVPRVASV